MLDTVSTWQTKCLKMDVVITNDDGNDADGLNFLANALIPMVAGDLYVVAPEQCHSGCSQQVTMNRPLAIRQPEPRRFVVSGSPADCVRMALTTLVPSCGLVLSGINHGGNMGHDILLSGTVGAAREAAMLGVSAVSFSQYFHGEAFVDWEQSAQNALKALEVIASLKVSGTALWNVNLPHKKSGTKDEVPIVLCRPCTAPLPIAYEERNDAFCYDGRRYHEREQHPGTDVTTCFGGAIALSRLAIGPRGMEPTP